MLLGFFCFFFTLSLFNISDDIIIDRKDAATMPGRVNVGVNSVLLSEEGTAW